MIQRIGVVNRGEAAVRFFATLDSLRREDSSAPEGVALYTDADEGALFVEKGCKSARIGEGRAAYLDASVVLAALKETGCDAAWLGWGFAAENADFAATLEAAGITLLSPASETMRALGDKIKAKELAESLGVPVAKWASVANPAEAKEVAASIGYPVLLKAASGGGGRGIRRVDSEDQLESLFESAQGEAARSFGDAGLMVEELFLNAHHVEVQVVGDGQGNVVTVGVRDCSLQRRRQKVIEECLSPVLNKKWQQELEEAACRLCKAVNYRSAGTVEFLFSPQAQRAVFLEVNTRLQVEHPVTEEVFGCDLVKAQIDLGRGLALPSIKGVPRGWAFEARVCAEDPDNDFSPAPGKLVRFVTPAGPGVRVDTGFAEGDEVSPEFDALLAKVITWGPTRGEALARLERALEDMRVVIRGGVSNLAFLRRLVREGQVRQGEANTDFIDVLRSADAGACLEAEQADTPLAGAAGELATGAAQSTLHAPLSGACDCPSGALFPWHPVARERGAAMAIIAAAIDRFKERERKLLATVTGVFRYTDDPSRHQVMVGIPLSVYQISPDLFRVVGEDGALTASYVEENHCTSRLLILHQDRPSRIERVVGDRNYLVEGIPHKISLDAGGVVEAPSPAIVLSVPVQVGDQVDKGRCVVVLESMKMEMRVEAPQGGVVKEIRVAAGGKVAPGEALVVLDLEGAEGGEGQEAVVPALPWEPEHAVEPSQAARALVYTLMGWDLEPETFRRQIASLDGGRECLQIMEGFADLALLFDRRPRDPAAEGEVGGSMSPAGSAPATIFESFLRQGREALDTHVESLLLRCLERFGLDELTPSASLHDAVHRLTRAAARLQHGASAAIGAIHVVKDAPIELLVRLATLDRDRYLAVCEAADHARFELFEKPAYEQLKQLGEARALVLLEELRQGEDRWAEIVEAPESLMSTLAISAVEGCGVAAEAVARRSERDCGEMAISRLQLEPRPVHLMECPHQESWPVACVVCTMEELKPVAQSLVRESADGKLGHLARLDLVVVLGGEDGVDGEPDSVLTEEVKALLFRGFASIGETCVMVVPRRGGMISVRRYDRNGFERVDRRDILPSLERQFNLERLKNFELTRMRGDGDTLLFTARARSNSFDARLLAYAEVRSLERLPSGKDGRVVLPHLERAYYEAVRSIQKARLEVDPGRRMHWNCITLLVRPPLDLTMEEIRDYSTRLAPSSDRLGLEKVVVRCRLARPIDGVESDPRRLVDISLGNPTGNRLQLSIKPASREPIEPHNSYESRVVQCRRRGVIYPYEMIGVLTEGDAFGHDGAEGASGVKATGSKAAGSARKGRWRDRMAKKGGRKDQGELLDRIPEGVFTEYDLDRDGKVRNVSDRPFGNNEAGVVMGVIDSRSPFHPGGLRRVLLLSDPTRSMGALAEPECRRIIAAFDLAERLGVPLEWVPVSSGARIDWDTGTENLDWTAAVLSRIVRFTQNGGEVNIIVAGVCVGAQAYWNAEATMMMHTRGLLIMTARGSMVLTGKKALDFSGSVSAEDELALGGYAKIMGPNGQGQIYAPDLGSAYRVLYRYYNLTYRTPGTEAAPLRPSADPADRDVCVSPYPANLPHGFKLVGDIFSSEHNPGRKKPFGIRPVMAAVSDQDVRPLERWGTMRDAETAVVWETAMGGRSVTMIGIESQPVQRMGFPPPDGPDKFGGGTLYPQSSRKVARAINSSSGRRPVVVLANLSGFDGSPESLRTWQLEYGAEIGRAVVNFKGSIIFAVVGRYHGGAYVVFSKTLNPNLKAVALEGSYASVIGGAPAAAVVFAGEVRKLAQARGGGEEAMAAVAAELGAKFDSIHSVERALKVGSIDGVIPPSRLRPWLIDALGGAPAGK